MDLEDVYLLDPETHVVTPLQVKLDPDGGFTEDSPAAALGSDFFRPLREWGAEVYTEDELRSWINQEFRRVRRAVRKASRELSED